MKCLTGYVKSCIMPEVNEGDENWRPEGPLIASGQRNSRQQLNLFGVGTHSLYIWETSPCTTCTSVGVRLEPSLPSRSRARRRRRPRNHRLSVPTFSSAIFKAASRMISSLSSTRLGQRMRRRQSGEALPIFHRESSGAPNGQEPR